MKKIVVFFMVFFLGMVGFASAQFISPIRILNNYRVIVGGTSIYAIDLTKTDYAEAQVFSIQFDKATPWFAGYSGATIPVMEWATSNHLPPGLNDTNMNALITGTSSYLIQENLEWVPIMPNSIAHDSGVSRFQWAWQIENGKYMFVRANNRSGVTDFRLTVDMGMGKFGYTPNAVPIVSTTTTYTVHSTSGASSFSVPQGTRRATVMPITNGIRYTLDGTSPNSSSKQATAGSLLTLSGQEARVFKFCGDNTSTTTVKPDYFTR